MHHRLELDRGEAERLVGAETFAALEETFDTGLPTSSASPPHTMIVVRRCVKRGQLIPFHTDHSKRTLQVALNGDDEYKGGRLVFATASGLRTPRRAAGTATLHDCTVAHGVTALLSGARYGFFLLAVPPTYEL